MFGNVSSCVQENFPQFSVGDTVCITIDEETLAQLISKWKEFAQYYSMVTADTQHTELH